MIADLLPTDDQVQIEDSIAGVLQRIAPLDRLRDESNFRGAAEFRTWGSYVDLGLFGLGLAADLGGIGYGSSEEALACRLLGRHLVSPTVVATMAAAHVAARAGRQDLLEALTSGAARAAFANPVSGNAAQLIDADGATLVLGWLDGRTVLAAAADCGDRQDVGAIDDTVSLERATLPSEPLCVADGVSTHVSLLASAYLVGLAEGARDMAVDYAKTRHQFGQPIGGFQSVKHALADMAVRAEAAQAQTWWATLDSQPAEVASARLLAGQAALDNARANIQAHGAMGFTFESDAHRYLKRAHVLAALNSSVRAEERLILAA